MSVKNFITRLIRRKFFQPFWERLERVSRIGQNYWSSTVGESGELHALEFASRSLHATTATVVIDAGANIGQFALLAAAVLKPGRIHSFEPSREAFNGLQATIHAAALDGIIDPQPFALGDCEGEAVLYSPHNGAATASLYNLHNPPVEFKAECSEAVAVTTLDKFCAEYGITDIGYLKIDVEGHELSVLRGAQRLLAQRRIRFVQFEFGEANIDSRTFIRDFFELLGADFEFYRIVSNGLRKVATYHSSLEIFATINYLAARKS